MSVAFPNPTAFETALAEHAANAGLGAARADAFEGFARAGVPHRRVEGWRWSDFRVALNGALPFAETVETSVEPSALEAVDAFVIVVDGGVARFEGETPTGLEISAVTGAGAGALLSDHPFGLAAAALSEGGLALYVSAEYQDERPVLVRYLAHQGQAHARLFPHVKAGAKLTLIESFEGAGAGFSNVALEAKVDADAEFQRIILQTGDDDIVQNALASVELAAGAQFHQSALLFGGKTMRLETRIAYRGAGASATLNSAALIAGARHGDVTSHIVHEAAGCETRQVHKAAITGCGRGVFQGKFYVARGAQQTDADMQANALLLSETAEANHKPELEIYADDVACAHGSTVGALDDQALFYMRQRGLDEASARGLLIEAFLQEAFDDIGEGSLRDVIAERVRAWLEGGVV